MSIVLALLIVADSFPIARAIWANRGTSLLHALGWAQAAWLSWGVAFLCDDGETAAMQPARYCALCLTGCAGVAVLGARRPQVLAWNLVVLSLLAVMAWPLFETYVLGSRTFDGLRIFFVAGTLAVGVLNYLPTRHAPAAFLLLVVGAGQTISLFAPKWLPGGLPICDFLLAAAPWVAWSCVGRKGDVTEFDRRWLDFRDRWGLVWSQRVREQFNHAAEHAGWGVKLMWRGLRQEKETPALAPAEQEKIVATLKSVLQRFVAADQR